MDRAKVKNILNFNFSRDRVFGFADAGFNRETIDKNLARLAEIGNSMVEVRDFLTEEEIRLLVQRLHKLWTTGAGTSGIELSLLESRSIGYGLDKSTEPGFVYFLQRVLEQPENWTPSCLKGFLHSTLRLWTDLNPAVRDANSKFIARHSTEVDGELSKAAPYISADGPVKLGEDTRKRKKSYLWAPSAVLMPTTRLNYTYFSEMLLTYFQDVKKGEYDELKSALDLHNQARTDKILLPALIKKERQFNKSLLDIASKRIGDPFDEAKWAAFDGATIEQRKALQQARRILLGWIMQEIIRSFFEVLCHDQERKNFWSKHAHQISNFTVFGSLWSRQQVLGYLPAQTVLKHFNTVESTVDNCALAMYVGDYVIIEFTQVGALYAYRVDGSNYRQAFRHARNLSKIDDLKIPTISLLYDLEYSRFAREGKMDHRGSWAWRMDRWIDHQVAPTIENE